MSARLGAVVIGLLLLASAFGVVTGQYRARALFVELDRAQRRAVELDADFNRLRVDQARYAQPAAVESAARRLGLRPVDAKEMVYLPAGDPAGAAQGTRP